ncbi:MAG TPA: D-alanyl-D-alanine carboxypeptidase/D-alanyl-D-alanine-endopeptidase [Candidatus Acidoferrales bacterium]|nr:D-alanyl-D-alanine carboxypeptidase/D-alanyl-D-alanine-endopeptidase [Candidatus Acidoferrales bacterium]
MALLLACRLSGTGLPEAIPKLIDSSPAARTAFWGIQIVDLATGLTLYELNPDHFFVPASNTKLFSTSLALTRLGPEYTFTTRILSASPPDDQGLIRGSIRLAGGGDPNLSARTVPYRVGPTTGNPLAAIEDLANQVVARGVTRIEGDIIGDDTWYLWQPYAVGWAIDDPQSDDGPPVSALTLNDNTATLTIRPGATAGDPAALAWSPALEFYRIENRVRTVPAGGPRVIHFSRVPGSLDAQLWGTIPLRDRGQDLLLGIEDPALYTAQALRQALSERGVAVTGGAVARHTFPDEIADLTQAMPAPSAAVPAGAPAVPAETELARRVSAPLIEDLRITAKVSQNLHAEMALRAVARARRNLGSFEAGQEELKAFLTEIGIDPGAYHILDGSGLTRLNLVTPAAVVKLLRYMYDSPARDNWISLLPVGGQDGTLSSRFADSAGRVYAKTGSLSHVNALSGYVQRTNGSWVAFSILVNNYNGRAAEVRGIIDRICNLIE